MRARQPLAHRIHNSIEIGAGGCWLWTLSLSHAGYGRMGVGGRMTLAHIVSYELVYGPVPEGMNLDHLCHNRDLSCPGGDTCIHRRCCNPLHLEAVSQRTNAGRGARSLTRSGYCKSGRHRIEGPDDWLVHHDRRRCKKCTHERQARYDAKRRAK